MSDDRWYEILADVHSATNHFSHSAAIFDERDLDGEDFDAYAMRMAFMHAMQSGYSSLEKALLKILHMLREEPPTGGEWHADLVRRASVALVGRPAIISAELAPHVDEARKFRHRAAHGYDDFKRRRAIDAAAAATVLAKQLAPMIAAFRQKIDPD